MPIIEEKEAIQFPNVSIDLIGTLLTEKMDIENAFIILTSFWNNLLEENNQTNDENRNPNAEVESRSDYTDPRKWLLYVYRLIKQESTSALHLCSPLDQEIRNCLFKGGMFKPDWLFEDVIRSTQVHR